MRYVINRNAAKRAIFVCINKILTEYMPSGVKVYIFIKLQEIRLMFRLIAPWIIVALLIGIAGQLHASAGDQNWTKQCTAIALSIVFILISLAPDYADRTASLRLHGAAFLSAGIVSAIVAIIQKYPSIWGCLFFYGGIIFSLIGIALNIAAVAKDKSRATVLKCIGTFGTVAGYAAALLLGAW